MFDEMSKHMGDITGELRKQMTSVAPVPPGQRERSPQEQAGLWRSMTSLPEGEFRSLIRDMAARAGHSPFEESPCEVCSMVAKYGLKAGS